MNHLSSIFLGMKPLFRSSSWWASKVARYGRGTPAVNGIRFQEVEVARISLQDNQVRQHNNNRCLRGNYSHNPGCECNGALMPNTARFSRTSEGPSPIKGRRQRFNRNLLENRRIGAMLLAAP